MEQSTVTYNAKYDRLVLQIDEQGVPNLYPLLQQGVVIRFTPGQTIDCFLQNQLGLPSQYIAQHVSTVFLNSKPVDDIHTAVLHENDTLALSGAMPGLVGAIMRRGSYYSSFRAPVTHDESTSNNKKPGTDTGDLRIKLFNKILREVGPPLLKSGVIVSPGKLADCLPSVTPHCSKLLWNSIDIHAPILTETVKKQTGEVMIKIIFE